PPPGRCRCTTPTSRRFPTPPGVRFPPTWPAPPAPLSPTAAPPRWCCSTGSAVCSPPWARSRATPPPTGGDPCPTSIPPSTRSPGRCTPLASPARHDRDAGARTRQGTPVATVPPHRVARFGPRQRRDLTGEPDVGVHALHAAAGDLRFDAAR